MECPIFSKKNICAVILPLIVISSCSMMEIVFPKGKNRSDFDIININESSNFVTGNGKISIGSFTAVIDRSWTKKYSSNDFVLFGSSKTISAKQTYKFKLTGPDGFNWEGKCIAGAEMEKESFKLFKFESTSETLNKNNLMGEFKSCNKKIDLYLEGSDAHKTGSIRYNDISLDIQMRLERSDSGSSNNTIGYQIYNHEVLVAVAGPSSMDKALYVRKNIDQNLLPIIINSAVALVGYQDMSSNVKDSGKK
jgi:hypothetical protein